MGSVSALPGFRRAAQADLGQLARMVKEYYAFDHIPFDLAHTRAVLGTLLRRPALGGAWLVMSANRVAGYVVLTPCFSLEFGREVFIDELYIRASHRGRGLGRAAVAFAERWARRHGVKAIHVVSERHNPAARAVYRAAGFGTADRFLMTRRVDSPARPARSNRQGARPHP